MARLQLQCLLLVLKQVKGHFIVKGEKPTKKREPQRKQKKDIYIFPAGAVFTDYLKLRKGTHPCQ